jgi:hypothetical protein
MDQWRAARVTRRVISAPKGARADLFSELDGELWLAKRLGAHGVAVFGGVSDRAERVQRIRQAIRDNGLEQVICGRRDHKPSTYREVFQRLYGEPL